MSAPPMVGRGAGANPSTRANVPVRSDSNPSSTDLTAPRLVANRNSVSGGCTRS